MLVERFPNSDGKEGSLLRHPAKRGMTKQSRRDFLMIIGLVRFARKDSRVDTIIGNRRTGFPSMMLRMSLGNTEGLDHGRVEICPIQEFPATPPLLSNKFQQNSHSQKGKELSMDVASWEKLPKHCKKDIKNITPTLPSPLRGGGLGWGGKAHQG